MIVIFAPGGENRAAAPGDEDSGLPPSGESGEIRLLERVL